MPQQSKTTVKLSKRDKYLRRTYGITEADYNLLLKYQKFVCAVCKSPPKTKSLHVDHNHVTGLVRGLLCFRCNKLVIGKFNDPKLFYNAYLYLKNPPFYKLKSLRRNNG